MSTRTLLPVALVLGLGACNSLGLGGEPEQLNLTLDASGTDQITLIISDNWVFQQDPACDEEEQGCAEVVRVLEADTATVTPPFERTYDFTNTLRYLVHAFPTGGVAATVSMRIDIDGREWFNESRLLTPDGNDGDQEMLEFLYQWQEPRIR